MHSHSTTTNHHQTFRASACSFCRITFQMETPIIGSANNSGRLHLQSTLYYTYLYYLYTNTTGKAQHYKQKSPDLMLILNMQFATIYSQYPSSSSVKPGRLIFNLINLMPHPLHLFCHLLKLSIKHQKQNRNILIRKNSNHISR